MSIKEPTDLELQHALSAAKAMVNNPDDYVKDSVEKRIAAALLSEHRRATNLAKMLGKETSKA